MGEAFDNFIDGMGDFIGQGADEVASALFKGNAYAPQAMEAASPIDFSQDVAPVEAAPVEVPTMDAPVIDSGWGEQAPMGFPEIGYSDNATIIDMAPQVEAPSFDQLLDNYASQAPPEVDQEMER